LKVGSGRAEIGVENEAADIERGVEIDEEAWPWFKSGIGDEVCGRRGRERVAGGFPAAALVEVF